MTILEKIYEAEKFDLSLQKKLSTLSVFVDAENNFLFKLSIEKLVSRFPEIFEAMFKINQELKFRY